MVDHLNVSYLYKKRGVFYFSKCVPCDVKSYYRSDRIVYIGSAADRVLRVLTILMTHTESYSRVNVIRVIDIWLMVLECIEYKVKK